MIRVVSFSTLYPNAADPHRGAFLRARLKALREHARGDVDVRVIAPVPYYPAFLPGKPEWRAFARAPRASAIEGFEALHPRYVALPKAGVATHVSSLARAGRLAFRRIERDFAPDLVEAHYLFPDGAAAALVARAAGRPLLVVARGTDAHTFPRDPALRRKIAEVLANADRVAAVSGGLARELEPLLPPGTRAAVIRNGVDTRLFHPRPVGETRAALGLPARAIVAIAVGRLVPVKRPLVVVETVARLQSSAAAADKSLRAMLVGSGELARRVSRAAESLGMTSSTLKVVPEMSSDRLALHLAAADVCLHASEREGCPNVVVEALASGTPVAASPSAGAIEVFEAAGQGGVLAETGDAAGLAAAAERALGAPSDREAIAAAAARAFRWEDVARRTVALYREAVGQRR